MTAFNRQIDQGNHRRNPEILGSPASNALVQESQLRKQTAKNEQKLVFVRMPNAGHPVPLRLNGDETPTQLLETLRNLTKFSSSDDAFKHQFLCDGRQIKNICELRANATLTVVTTALPGGTEEGGGKNTGGGDNVPQSEIYATFECVREFREEAKDGLEFTPSEEYDKTTPPVILKDEAFNDETIFTLAMALQKFEDSFGKEKGSENDYNFTYFFGSWDSADNPADYQWLDDDEQDTFEESKKKSFSKNFRYQMTGGPIKVVVKKGRKTSTKNSPDMKFLEKIPHICNRNTKKKMSQALKQEQKDMLERFENKTMELEDLEFILMTMTDDQLDNLLLSFQTNHRDRILKYLLIKANQWTDISEPMLNNCSKELKMLQVRRLINSLNNSFSRGETDSLMTELLKEEQEALLHGIVEVFSDKQLVELFMQMTDIGQHSKLIQILNDGDVDNENGDIKGFWDLLSRDRKKEIFAAMDKIQQFKFIATDEYDFDDSQKQKVWDIIGRDSRKKMWKMTSDPQLQEATKDDFLSSQETILTEGVQDSQPRSPSKGSGLDRKSAVSGLDKPRNPLALQIEDSTQQLNKLGALGTNLISSFKLNVQQGVDKLRTRQLRRVLLRPLNYVQWACLWSTLEDEASVQQEMLQLIVSENVKEGIEFLKILNHDKQCIFIKQIKEDQLLKLFLSMDSIGDQIELLLFLDSAIRDKFKDALTPERRKEMFYSRRFQIDYQTKMSSKDFIYELLNEHMTNNNQVVPFEKIEDNYVQVIPNPNVENGYITVQIIEPQYTVSNYERPEDVHELDVQQEMRETVNIPEKCKNDRFRFTQNHYGQVQETEPTLERNSEQVAIISFWEYTGRLGMLCTHSFLAQNPLLAVQSSEHKHVDEIVLYTGLNGDVFFFNKNYDSQASDQKNYDLCVQIINRQQYPERGETQRDTSECCFTYLIPPKSELYDFLSNGRFSFQKYGTVLHMLNTVPTMISEGGQKLVVFSHTPIKQESKHDDGRSRFYGGPSLYFYDVDQGKETHRIRGGEAIISYNNYKNTNYVPDKDSESGPFGSMAGQLGRLMYLGNAMMMKETIWGQSYQLQKTEDATKLEQSALDKNSAIAISLLVNWDKDEDHVLDFVLPNEDGILLSGYEDYEKNKEKPWDAKFVDDSKWTKYAKLFFIEIKDQENVFAQRYFRQTPVIIEPFGKRNDEGILQSFALLFQHMHAFTFTQVEQKLAMTEEKRKAYAETLETIKNEEAEAIGSHKGSAEELEEKKKDFKKQREAAKQKATPTYYRFRCKYSIPDASNIVHERGKKNEVVTYIQKSARNEHILMKGREIIARSRAEKDGNEMEGIEAQILLYNVSEHKVNFDNQEKEPSDSDTRAVTTQMGGDQLLSYTKNNYPNKAGVGDIWCIAGPVLFTKEAIVSSWQARTRDETHRPFLSWQIVPTKDVGHYQSVKPGRQRISVDYPIMVYKGYMPDNRELVVINLAKKNAPQQILHLQDMQFLCFVSHNNSQRSAKVGFLALKNEQVKLCWLVVTQAFKHTAENDLSTMKIVEIDIDFRVPIVDLIDGVQRAEFVNEPNVPLDQCEQGALVIQHASDIYVCNLLTGHYENVTMGTMQEVLMIRGYNSYLYYVKQAGETDVAVIALKLSKMSTNWQINEVEVHKINEGCVIALELDPNNRDRTDSVYTYNNKLIEEQPEVLNQIFVIDDKETLYHIRQKSEDETGSRYLVMEERNMSMSRYLSRELVKHKNKGPFGRTAITSRSITINNKNFNFYNGHEWDLDISRRDADGNSLEQEDNEISDEEDDLTDAKIRETVPKSVSKVNKVRLIRWTSRQLLEATYLDFDQSKGPIGPQGRPKGQFVETNALITKLLPGSRRQDIIGLRGLRDMVSLNMISDNLFLVRFRGSDLSQSADYWTVISSNGQICPIPEKAKKHLIWSNFSAGDSRIQRFDTCVVLRGGHERVISFGSDVAYKEKQITKIQFTRKGEVGWITQYKKSKYEDSLREKIADQLVTNKSLRKPEVEQQISQAAANKMADTLKYSEKILSRHSGDLYRIASIIVDDSFNAEAIVNPLSKTEYESGEGDALNMGIFEVGEKSNKEANCSLGFDENANYKLIGKWRGTEATTFNIVLFLCKNQTERFHLEQAGFTMVCNQLCWSYPTESYVHILDIRKIHEAKEVQRNSLAGRFMEGIRGLGGLGGVSGVSGNASALSIKSSPQKSPTKSPPKSPSRFSRLIDEKDDDFKRVNKSGIVPLNDSEDDSPQPTEADKKPSYLPPDKLTEPITMNEQVPSVANSGNLGTALIALKAMQKRNTQTISADFVTKLKKNAGTQESESEDDDDADDNILQTKILWKDFQTYVINLSVMCDNENDKFAMHLSEMPHNMQYSLNNREKVDFSQGEPAINENMLQIAVKDRICIFDVSEDFNGVKRAIKEVKVFNATSQFISSESYVESGFNIVRSYDDPTKTKDGYLVDRITQNRNKELCFAMQDRVNYDIQLKFDNLPQTPICLSIFKKYAEVDLIELKRISDKIEKHGRLDNIDFQTILSTFKGHSAFSIFSQEEKFHEQMLIQVQEEEFLEEMQEDETTLENNMLRRLFSVLNLPTPDMVKPAVQSDPTEDLLDCTEDQIQQEENDEDKTENAAAQGEEAKKENKIDFGSVLRKSIYSENMRIKSCLLTITNKCAECSLVTFCANQDAFGELIKDLSSNAIELIADSFVETPFTKRILNCSWYPEMEPTITMRMDSSLITQDDVNNRIQEILQEEGVAENEMTKTQVEVRLLDLSWLLADRKTFVHFTTVLGNASNDQIYTTDLLKTLLVEFWEENYQKILKRCLLPWIGYAICTQFFFVQSLRGDKDEMSQIWIFILGLAVLIGLFYQISIEWRQSKNDALLEYLTTFVNLMDIFQYLSTLWIVTIQMLDTEVPGRSSQRVIAAISTLFLWIKVLDWMQLFGPTSFFIKLITETIIDIQHFFIIFLVALFMIGVPMYILQLNRGEENAIVEETFGNFWLLNAFYNQYMLALGEFTIDAFDDEPQVYLCYAMFLGATFFTQITFLNMLIALMGDTYGKVMEAKETYQLLTQRSIMGDYAALIDDEVDPDDFKPFMFIIQQKLEGDNDPNGAWEGNLTVIKKAIENGISGLQKQLDKKLLSLDVGIKVQTQRDTRFDKESRGQYVKIMEKFQHVDRALEQIEPEKTDKILEIVNRQQQNMKATVNDLKTGNIEGRANIQKQIEELTKLQNDNNDSFQSQLKELKENQEIFMKEQIEAAKAQAQAPPPQPAAEPAAQAQPALEPDAAAAVADPGSQIIPQSAESAQEQSERLEKAIDESKRASNDAIARLDQQQQALLQQLSDLQGKQTVIQQSMQESHEQLSSKVNETQSSVLQQLQGMRSDVQAVQQQQQEAMAAGPGSSAGSSENTQLVLSTMQEMVQQLNQQMVELNQQTIQQLNAKAEENQAELKRLVQDSEDF